MITSSIYCKSYISGLSPCISKASVSCYMYYTHPSHTTHDHAIPLSTAAALVRMLILGVVWHVPWKRGEDPAIRAGPLFHSPPQYMTNSTHSCCHCKSSSSFTNLCAPLQQDLKEWKTRLFSDNVCLSLCMCVCVCVHARVHGPALTGHICGRSSAVCCWVFLLTSPTNPLTPMDRFHRAWPFKDHHLVTSHCWWHAGVGILYKSRVHGTHRHTYLHTDTHTYTDTHPV